MAVGITEISWGDAYEGGEVLVDRYGVTVYTNCHGCGSAPLADIDDLIRLRNAINQILIHKGVRF